MGLAGWGSLVGAIALGVTDMSIMDLQGHGGRVGSLWLRPEGLGPQDPLLGARPACTHAGAVMSYHS